MNLSPHPLYDRTKLSTVPPNKQPDQKNQTPFKLFFQLKNYPPIFSQNKPDPPQIILQKNLTPSGFLNLPALRFFKKQVRPPPPHVSHRLNKSSGKSPPPQLFLQKNRTPSNFFNLPAPPTTKYFFCPDRTPSIIFQNKPDSLRFFKIAGPAEFGIRTYPGHLHGRNCTNSGSAVCTIA